MFTGLDVVDVSYRGGHVIHGRAAMRRAHLARMGVAAKLEAAAASPRLLDANLFQIFSCSTANSVQGSVTASTARLSEWHVSRYCWSGSG